MIERLIRISSVAFLLFLLAFYATAQQTDGQVDLSQFNFEEKGPANLSGKWEFYWNRLLSPEDFLTPQKPAWIHPSSWHRQGEYAVLGFATYRIKLKVPENQWGLSLYFPIINSSSKIWINGELASET